MRGEDVESIAERVLLRNHLGGIPVDVDAIARAEGLDFEYAPLDVVSGGYTRIDATHGMAVINSTEHPLRQRFSKAHELAHHLLDDPSYVRKALHYPDLRLPTGYRGRDRHWAHERFAACLLMPRSYIGEFVRVGGWKLTRSELIRDVGRKFQVTRRAAEVRLGELGHIEEGSR